MNDAEVRYEYLRPEQIREQRDSCPIAYIPLGTLEWHGPHNPVGLDGLKAHALCVRAAVEAGGLVFPVVWYGEHRESHLMEINESVGTQILDRMGLDPSDFERGYTGAGTIFQQAQDYLALLWKIANQVKALGFEGLIFFNGHYPLSHYGRFLEHLIQRHLKMRTWAGHEGDLLREAGDPGHGDHAGKWETSLMMSVDESRVRLDALREADEFVGCGSNALDSSVEQGEEWARQIVSALVAKCHALIEH